MSNRFNSFFLKPPLVITVLETPILKISYLQMPRHFFLCHPRHFRQSFSLYFSFLFASAFFSSANCRALAAREFVRDLGSGG